MNSTRELQQADGSLRCPRCGGTQFSERHSTGRKVAFGFATLLGTPNQLQCVACGMKYTRVAAIPPAPAGAVPARPD